MSKVNDMFENRKDDWLAKEKAREKRISVWEFDDRASVLKHQHEEDCEAEEVRREHYEQHDKIHNVPPKATRNNTAKNTAPGQNIVSLVIFFIVFVFIAIVAVIISGFTTNSIVPAAGFMFVVPFIIYIIIFVSIINSIRKRGGK